MLLAESWIVRCLPFVRFNWAFGFFFSFVNFFFVRFSLFCFLSFSAKWNRGSYCYFRHSTLFEIPHAAWALNVVGKVFSFYSWKIKNRNEERITKLINLNSCVRARTMQMLDDCFIPTANCIFMKIDFFPIHLIILTDYCIAGWNLIGISMMWLRIFFY